MAQHVYIQMYARYQPPYSGRALNFNGPKLEGEADIVNSYLFNVHFLFSLNNRIPVLFGVTM